MQSFGRIIKLALLAAVDVVLLSSSASAAEITGSRVQAESVTTAITTNQYFSDAEPNDGSTPNSSLINSNGTVNYPVTIPSGASANAVVVRSRSASTSTGSVNLTVVVDGVDQPAKTITKTQRAFATRSWNLSTALEAGSHTIGLKATKTTTRNREVSDYFYLDGTSGPPPDTTPDTTPPDTSIASGPAEGSTDIDGDVRFDFSGTDDVGVASFECAMDGAAFAACTSPQAYSALSDGAHAFSVRAKDAAGNVDASPAVRNFSVAIDASPATHQADSANDLVQSIGVNTHVTWFSTQYGNYPAVKAALDELGVKHVRDATPALSNATAFQRYSDLSNTLGIRAIMNANVGSWPSPPTTDQFDKIVSQSNGALEGFEGPNEYNNTNKTGGNPDWAAELTAYQSKMFENLNASPSARDIPLLASPLGMEGGTYPTDPLELGPYSDANSMHSYAGFTYPTGSNRSDYASLLYDRDIPNAIRVGAPGRDLYSTETGYTTALGYTNQLSDEAKARYTPRLSLEYYKAGVTRGYHYQLLDASAGTTAQDHFGLINANWEKLPAFRALENTIDVLEDPGGAYSPGTLDYELLDANPSTHSLLLEKRNGVFYLALWQEVKSYDQVTDTDLTIAPDSVTLNLEHAQPISVFDVHNIPSSGISDDAEDHPARSLTQATSITEDIGDTVKIIRIG